MLTKPRFWPCRDKRPDDILKILGVIMSALTDLQTEVAATATAQQAAITAIQAIAAELATALANQANPDAALVDLTAQLTTSSAALSAAVAAATPAPAPAPTPAA